MAKTDVPAAAAVDAVKPSTTAAQPVETQPQGDKPVAPPTDAASTTTRLQEAVPAIGAPPKNAEGQMDARRVEAEARATNLAALRDAPHVPPTPDSRINKPTEVTAAKVTPKADVDARAVAAQERAAATLAGGDRQPGSPPAATSDARTAAISRQETTANGADRQPGNPPAGPTDARTDAVARRDTTAAAGADRPPGSPPAGPTDARTDSITRRDTTAAAGADRPPGSPPAGPTDARTDAITRRDTTAAAGADRPPGSPPAGPTDARTDARTDAITRRDTTAAAGADRPPGTPPAGPTDARTDAITRRDTTAAAGADRPPGSPPAGPTDARTDAITRRDTTAAAGADRPPGSPPGTPTDARAAAIARRDATASGGERPATPPGNPPANPTDARTAAIARRDATASGGERPATPPGNPPANPTDARAAAIARRDATASGGDRPATPPGNPPANPTDARAAAIARRDATASGGDRPATPPGSPPANPTDARAAAIARRDATASGGERPANPPANPTDARAAAISRAKATAEGGQNPTSDGAIKPAVKPENPNPRADASRAEAQRRVAETSANANLTPEQKRAQVVADRSAARVDRAATLEAKQVQGEEKRAVRKAEVAPVSAPGADGAPSAQQVRAQVIADNAAAKRAERQATLDVKRAGEPPAPPTDKGRPRSDAAPVAEPFKPVKPSPGDAGGTRPPKVEGSVKPSDSAPPPPIVKRGTPGDSSADAPRPGRDKPVVRPAGDPPVDPTVSKPGRDRPARTEPGAEIPSRGKPALPGDAPPVVAGRDRPGRSPDGDQLTRAERRRQAADATTPLDPRQQKFLADQFKGNDPKSQAFRENFERLSSQNRNNLMNLDGKQQLDMIAKMSRDRGNLTAIEGKLATGVGRGITGDGIEGKAKLPGDAVKPGAGDLAKLSGRQDLKIPGLDTADPANRKFMNDVTTRLSQLKLDGTTANMKVSDVLKGLDPQKVSALEKFLTNNNNTNLDAGKLTIGQLDANRLTQLMKGSLDGGLVAGKQLTPREAMLNLQNSARADGTNTLANLGRNLNDMSTPNQPGKLSDLVVRNLDLGVGQGRMQGEFSAKLNPIQELNVRNMIENSSRTAMQFDFGMGRFDFSARGDGSLAAPVSLSQIIATSFGDGRGDFAVRGDMVRSNVQIEAARQIVVDGYDSSSVIKSQEYISKLPIDATTGLPYDPSTGKLLDPNTGRAIGDKVSEEKKSQGKWDDEEEMDEKDKKKQKKDSEIDNDKAKQKAMLLILHAKKKREQEIRDKQAKDEKQKKEDETRVKYICKDGDTIQSIALKQLRDSRVAPLIYQINKEVISTKIVNGETVPLLHAGLVIWLPSPKETKEFRQKLVSSVSTPTTGQKFATAEDELAAKFGAGWAPGQGSGIVGDQPAQEMSPVERKLMEEAMAEAKRRKDNIEKALGPITGSTTRGARADGEHLTYQVRLGDTLRSVATKHPSIGDVNLWRLLAEINEMTIEVDAKGQPKAGLVRGGKIKIPTVTEIADYRQRIGSMAGQSMTREQRVAKNCPKCGRMTVQSASLCPCGHEFTTDKPVETTTQTSVKDAGTQMLEAINDGPSTVRRQGPKTEDLDSEPIPTVRVGPPTNEAVAPVETREAQERTKEVAKYVEPTQEWAACKDFEPTCRLTKSALAWDAAEGRLIIHLQIRNDENSEWFPILEYEIYGSYSIRHTFVRQTNAKKTVKIDLPAAAAMELAQNDLLANWSNYKVKYLLA